MYANTADLLRWVSLLVIHSARCCDIAARCVVVFVIHALLVADSEANDSPQIVETPSYTEIHLACSLTSLSVCVDQLQIVEQCERTKVAVGKSVVCVDRIVGICVALSANGWSVSVERVIARHLCTTTNQTTRVEIDTNNNNPKDTYICAPIAVDHTEQLLEEHRSSTHRPVTNERIGSMLLSVLQTLSVKVGVVDIVGENGRHHALKTALKLTGAGYRFDASKNRYVMKLGALDMSVVDTNDSNQSLHIECRSAIESTVDLQDKVCHLGSQHPLQISLTTKASDLIRRIWQMIDGDEPHERHSAVPLPLPSQKHGRRAHQPRPSNNVDFTFVVDATVHVTADLLAVTPAVESTLFVCAQAVRIKVKTAQEHNRVLLATCETVSLQYATHRATTAPGASVALVQVPRPSMTVYLGSGDSSAADDNVVRASIDLACGASARVFQQNHFRNVIFTDRLERSRAPDNRRYESTCVIGRNARIYMYTRRIAFAFEKPTRANDVPVSAEHSVDVLYTCAATEWTEMCTIAQEAVTSLLNTFAADRHFIPGLADARQTLHKRTDFSKSDVQRRQTRRTSSVGNRGSGIAKQHNEVIAVISLQEKSTLTVSICLRLDHTAAATAGTDISAGVDGSNDSHVSIQVSVSKFHFSLFSLPRTLDQFLCATLANSLALDISELSIRDSVKGSHWKDAIRLDSDLLRVRLSNRQQYLPHRIAFRKLRIYDTAETGIVLTGNVHGAFVRFMVDFVAHAKAHRTTQASTQESGSKRESSDEKQQQRWSLQVVPVTGTLSYKPITRQRGEKTSRHSALHLAAQNVPLKNVSVNFEPYNVRNVAHASVLALFETYARQCAPQLEQLLLSASISLPGVQPIVQTAIDLFDDISNPNRTWKQTAARVAGNVVYGTSKLSVATYKVAKNTDRWLERQQNKISQAALAEEDLTAIVPMEGRRQATAPIDVPPRHATDIIDIDQTNEIADCEFLATTRHTNAHSYPLRSIVPRHETLSASSSLPQGHYGGEYHQDYREDGDSCSATESGSGETLFCDTETTLLEDYTGTQMPKSVSTFSAVATKEPSETGTSVRARRPRAQSLYTKQPRSFNKGLVESAEMLKDGAQSVLNATMFEPRRALRGSNRKRAFKRTAKSALLFGLPRVVTASVASVSGATVKVAHGFCNSVDKERGNEQKGKWKDNM